MFISYPKQELTLCKSQFWNQSQRLSPVQLSLEGGWGGIFQKRKRKESKLRFSRDEGERKYMSFRNHLSWVLERMKEFVSQPISGYR